MKPIPALRVHQHRRQMGIVGRALLDLQRKRISARHGADIVRHGYGFGTLRAAPNKANRTRAVRLVQIDFTLVMKLVSRCCASGLPQVKG